MAYIVYQDLFFGPLYHQDYTHGLFLDDQVNEECLSGVRAAYFGQVSHVCLQRLQGIIHFFVSHEVGQPLEYAKERLTFVGGS